MAVADYEAASEILIERFKTQWDITHPEVSGARDVPVAWPNVTFDPHKDFDEGTQDGWVRFTILISGALQASASGTKVRQRTVGVVEVQVFTPSGTGDRTAASIADDVVSALQFQTLDGVVISTATPMPVGETGEGFYQVNVSANFRYDTLVKASQMITGNWENPVLIGTIRLFEDTTNDILRTKTGSDPTSVTDGVEMIQADTPEFIATWDSPILIGTKRLWHDVTNDVLLVKTGSDPTSESDGLTLSRALADSGTYAII